LKHYKLALLGFGSVGQALAELLLRKKSELRAKYQIAFTVSAIGTHSHGRAIDFNGIDLKSALDTIRAGGSLDTLSAVPAPENGEDFVRQSGADVLFENTPVNYQTGQPAIAHLRAALDSGQHAITANKGPVVHAYRQLTDLAAAHGRKFYFESAVMDGAPIFSLYRATLPAANLQAFRGVLNSTTNLILSRMEQQQETFDEAVAYAQSIGIAESDPSGDVDGWDAAVKVAALVTVMMDIPLTPQQVERQGIRQITTAEIARAQAEGKRWKLICSARRTKEGVQAEVSPQLVAPSSPLYNVMGTSSSVQLESDVLGLLSVIEENPGPHTTAYGLLADFINAARE